MNWISSNIDRIVSLTISHVWLTLIPTVVGLIIALPLGWWAHRFKRGPAAIVGTAGRVGASIQARAARPRRNRGPALHHPLARAVHHPSDHPRHEDPRSGQHRCRADALHVGVAGSHRLP